MHPMFTGKVSAQLLTASAVPCRRTKTDLFVSDLAVKWPGVRHMLALDQAQAATYVVTLTCALAMQPYKAQVLLCPFSPVSLWLLINVFLVAPKSRVLSFC